MSAVIPKPPASAADTADGTERSFFTRTFQRGLLGFRVNEDKVVTRVTHGAQAEHLGVCKGDTVHIFGGEHVEGLGVGEFFNLVRTVERPADVEFSRMKDLYTATFDTSAGAAGFSTALDKHGNYTVDAVESESQAAALGVRIGDTVKRVVGLDGIREGSFDALMHNGKQVVEVTLDRSMPTNCTGDDFTLRSASGRSKQQRATLRKVPAHLRRQLKHTTLHDTSDKYWEEVMGQNHSFLGSLLHAPPLMTITLLIMSWAMFYGYTVDPLLDFGYRGPHAPGGVSDWYSPVSYMVMHVDQRHLIFNSVLLTLGGLLLEITETRAGAWAIVYGSAVAGAGGHGFHDDANVVGASGACYGVVWSQVALLALNWHEMPNRYERLVILAVLAFLEIYEYLVNKAEGTSHACHGYGALAGGAIALVCGVNTVFEHWEIYLSAAGVTTCLLLWFAFFSTEQYAVACWFLPVLPVLFFDAWRSYMRAEHRKIHVPKFLMGVVDVLDPLKDSDDMGDGQHDDEQGEGEGEGAEQSDSLRTQHTIGRSKWQEGDSTVV